MLKYFAIEFNITYYVMIILFCELVSFVFKFIPIKFVIIFNCGTTDVLRGSEGNKR